LISQVTSFALSMSVYSCLLHGFWDYLAPSQGRYVELEWIVARNRGNLAHQLSQYFYGGTERLQHTYYLPLGIGNTCNSLLKVTAYLIQSVF